MHRSLTYLPASLAIAITLVVACGNDSNDGPAGQAGSAGQTPGGSTGQAGSAGQGGKAGVAGGGGSGVAGGSNAGAGGGGSSSAGSGGEQVGGGGSSNAGAASGGAAGGDEVVAECLDAPVLEETRTEALHFQGTGLELGIVRRVDPDAFGTSGTTVWLPQRFALVRGDVAECVSDAVHLTYTVSHHNFDDSMTAVSGSETWTFKQTREDYDMPTSWSLEARTNSGLAWGPVTLTLLSCQRLDESGSCAEMYQ